MKIVITDSGLGGLGITAGIFEKGTSDREVALVFANAQPAPERGYNKMDTADEKREVFNSALEGFYSGFEPDLIIIACNTLSVLADDTEFSKNNKCALLNIVDYGIKKFSANYIPGRKRKIILLGTETTVSSGMHKDELEKRGWNSENIIPVACSGLAGAIEKDFEGEDVLEKINRAFSLAKEAGAGDADEIIIYIGCTHYSYVKSQIYERFCDLPTEKINIFDPGEYIIEDMAGEINSHCNEGKNNLEIFSKIIIPDAEINGIYKLLKHDYPLTAARLLDYKIRSDLF